MVSIVIPNWNTTKWLEKCIEAVKTSSIITEYEIIVVDNDSKDGFDDWKKSHPDIHFILNDRNLGFSISIVQGLLISKGKYVCFLNSDAEPKGDWLDKLVDYLEIHQNCAIVGPSSENVCNLMQDSRNNKGENLITGDVIPFMCVVIPKKIFLQVGLPKITYGEDTEFSTRVRNFGYNIAIVGSAYVKHEGSRGWVDNEIGRNHAEQMKFAESLGQKWCGLK